MKAYKIHYTGVFENLENGNKKEHKGVAIVGSDVDDIGDAIDKLKKNIFSDSPLKIDRAEEITCLYLPLVAIIP